MAMRKIQRISANGINKWCDACIYECLYQRKNSKRVRILPPKTFFSCPPVFCLPTCRLCCLLLFLFSFFLILCIFFEFFFITSPASGHAYLILYQPYLLVWNSASLQSVCISGCTYPNDSWKMGLTTFVQSILLDSCLVVTQNARTQALCIHCSRQLLVKILQLYSL